MDVLIHNKEEPYISVENLVSEVKQDSIHPGYALFRYVNYKKNIYIISYSIFVYKFNVLGLLACKLPNAVIKNDKELPTIENEGD